ncbi:MAG: class I SAM-dependent methyltransferase [Proteobacteria bacterium]|nr:class I SAM-dependent methyltransferase [Pseudomonadota bacterium]
MTTTYTDEQYELAYPPGIEHHWWSAARNKLIAKLLLEKCADGNFLEVGCGKGVVVKGLRREGRDVRGVELANVQPLSGVEQWVDSGVDACDLALETRLAYDGLLLLDVIEHLPDPEEFLNKLVESFPNVSFVIVTVPAGRELWSNYDEFSGHHRRYSLDMLENMGATLGWTLDKAEYFFRLSYLPMRLMTLLGIDRRIKMVAPGKALRPLHRLVCAISRFEQALLPRGVRGSSAYAVYRVGAGCET